MNKLTGNHLVVICLVVCGTVLAINELYLLSAVIFYAAVCVEF